MALGLGLAAGINSAVGLGKAIFGGIQAIRGRKQMKSLLANRPQYDISQGYKDALSTYQQLASGNMPGFDIAKGMIEQNTANTNQALERGAMGSNQYMSGVLSGQNKQYDAIKNFYLANAQYQSQAKQNLAGAQNQFGQIQDTQFQTNQLDPWNIKANMANENRQAGAQNLFGGLGDIGGSLMNFAGTNAYMKALQALQPKETTT